MELYDYEFKIKDLEELINSQIFVYNGLGMEIWVDKVNDVIKDKNVFSVNLSDGIDQRKEGDVIDLYSWLSLKDVEK